jgi:predicted TIM-barrel fold metal-dependent hydrolase
MKTPSPLSRRDALKTLTTATAATAALATTVPTAVVAADAVVAPSSPRSDATTGSAGQAIRDRVFQTRIVDTHEHLVEERERIQFAASSRLPCDDWALLFSHYLNSDLVNAGMPKADLDRFLAPGLDPVAKWRLLAPHWPAARHTGYAQAVRIAIRELYGVAELSEKTVPDVQAGYERTRKPGFYRQILGERARIESCQVNCITGDAFKESDQPTLLMQDISIVGMFAGPNFKQYAPRTGIEPKSLADWHRVIDWWFDRYARYAVAVKSQQAYSRDIDYARVPPEQAEPVFAKIVEKAPVTREERKLLEDHLFWYAVDKATAHGLPVKLHTGYYAGHDSMPLGRLRTNMGSAAELCRLSPATKFVFMHIGYPHYEELLALAKHWSNAHVDMCWAWIINPIAAKDYLKKHIVTVAANKVLPFGADYVPVEPVLGHAVLARHGIAQALTELVSEGWLSLEEALELVDPILHGNAHRLFRLSEKTESLRQTPWNREAAPAASAKPG